MSCEMVPSSCMYGEMPKRNSSVMSSRAIVRMVWPPRSTVRRGSLRSATMPMTAPMIEASPVKMLRMMDASDDKPAAWSTRGA